LYRREKTDYGGLLAFFGILLFVLFFVGLWRAANDQGSYTSKVIFVRIAGFLFVIGGMAAFTGRGPAPILGIIFSILGLCGLFRKIPKANDTP
jgi:hypothetical protein